MNSWLYLIYAILIFSGFLMYFRIANFYEIVDLPNHRTMHDGSTIRGGGVVIFISVAFFSLFIDPPGFYFLAGIIIIGITGFLDDIINLSGKNRNDGERTFRKPFGTNRISDRKSIVWFVKTVISGLLKSGEWFLKKVFWQCLLILPSANRHRKN